MTRYPTAEVQATRVSTPLDRTTFQTWLTRYIELALSRLDSQPLPQSA